MSFSTRTGPPDVWADSNPPEFRLPHRRRSWRDLMYAIRIRPSRVGWREVHVEDEMGEFAVLDLLVHHNDGSVDVIRGKQEPRDMFLSEARLPEHV